MDVQKPKSYHVRLQLGTTSMYLKKSSSGGGGGGKSVLDVSKIWGLIDRCHFQTFISPFIHKVGASEELIWCRRKQWEINVKKYLPAASKAKRHQ